MGKCEVEYQETRFIYEPELTQVYVLLRAIGDCPITLQGWHHKTYPASVSALDILTYWKKGGEDDDPMLWPLEAPPDRRAR